MKRIAKKTVHKNKRTDSDIRSTPRLRSRPSGRLKRSSREDGLATCRDCLKEFERTKGHTCLPYSEKDVFAPFGPDVRSAYDKLRQFATSLGEQRIYNNARAVMFARRVCYMFVRPKKSHLELVFFLATDVSKRVDGKSYELNKNKISHTVRITHPDQIRGTLAACLRKAYQFADARVLRSNAC